VNINITVLACLKLVAVHKKFTVKFLIQFVKNQTSLCCNKGAVRVGVALISNVTDRLTLCIYIIHHVNKIQLVITVIAVTFCHSRIYSFQSAFYNIVHFLDLNLIFPQ